MITKEHIGPLLYGGAVTLTQWYDDKRMSQGKLTSKDVFKMVSTWTFLGIGVLSLVLTIWWRRYQGWTDRLTSGFLYGLPGFIYTTVKATSGTSRAAGGGAIAEAQAVLNQKLAAINKQLGAGKNTARSYQPQFNSVAQY